MVNPSTDGQSLLLLFVWIGRRRGGLTVAAVPTFRRTMRLQRHGYGHVETVVGVAFVIAARRGNILVVASDGDGDISLIAASLMGWIVPDPHGKFLS